MARAAVWFETVCGGGWPVSLLVNVYPSPSRVRAVYRFLLHHPNQCEYFDIIESNLTPQALKEEAKPSQMLSQVLVELVQLGLLEKQDTLYRLHPKLSDATRDPSRGEEQLPWTLLNLIFQTDREKDLLKNFAWFLMQSVTNPPGTWSEMEEALKREGLLTQLNINNTMVTQFQDWGVFLKLFITLPSKGRSVKCFPYPNKIIEQILPEIFHDKRTLTMEVAVERIAGLIPIIEHGEIWKEVRELGQLPMNTKLSPATSAVWLDFKERGIIDFSHESDAKMFFLSEGKEEIRVSVVTLLKEET